MFRFLSRAFVAGVLTLLAALAAAAWAEGPPTRKDASGAETAGARRVQTEKKAAAPRASAAGAARQRAWSPTRAAQKSPDVFAAVPMNPPRLTSVQRARRGAAEAIARRARAAQTEVKAASAARNP